MRIYVDAQLPPGIVRWLADNFNVDAIAVRDAGMRDAPDLAIFERARSERAAVLTKDSDFDDLVYRLGAPPKVIWVTCGNVSNVRLREIFATTFAAAMKLLETDEIVVEIGDA